MEYRRLGSAGLKVGVLSLGGWATMGEHVDPAVTRDIMRTAYEAGVNFFDNAETYGEGKSETAMGQVLTEFRRESFVVSTKIFWGGEGPNDVGLSRKHLTEGLHQALKRLQVDYVDLIFCHRPDPDTPIEETVWTMDNLIRQGKALYWGTSEWSAQQLTEAHSIARQHHLLPPQMEQPQYNLFEREKVEREYLPLYGLMGLGTTIWSPLAYGVLSGKYTLGASRPKTRTGFAEKWFRERALSPEREAKIKKLARVAADLDCSLAQLAIAWCIKNPHVSTAILGATRVDQIRENLKALDVANQLTPEVLERIEKIVNNKPA